MIARVWYGATPVAKGDDYAKCLERTGVKECRSTPGNRGVQVLRRDVEGRSEFVFISYWENLEVVHGFAGPDINRAVYFPEDKDFLVEMRPNIEHYEVVRDLRA